MSTSKKHRKPAHAAKAPATPAAPVPRNDSPLQGDGVRRGGSHDSARIEDSSDRSNVATEGRLPGTIAEETGLDGQDLREEQAELTHARHSAAAPVDDDDLFDLDEADELLERALNSRDR